MDSAMLNDSLVPEELAETCDHILYLGEDLRHVEGQVNLCAEVLARLSASSHLSLFDLRLC